MVRRRSATIQQVADEAGVSRAAVSKVIRDAYGVSDEMRNRVEAAIARLDYRPRVSARAMRGKSFTIGIEMSEIGNEFHSMIVMGAADALSNSEYQLVTAPIQPVNDARRALQNLADRQVDGIIAVSPAVPPEWLEELAAAVPLVMVGRPDVSDYYDTVTGDDEAGARAVMDHLIDLGHRRIAFLEFISPVGADDRANTAVAPRPAGIRKRVYLERMAELGEIPMVGSTRASEAEAADVAREMLAGHRPPTAIWGMYDTIAIGVLRAVAETGLTEDVSVVGYDDVTTASHPLISLTSVDQQGRAIGQEAARLLLERIDGRTEPVQIRMPVTLRARRSTHPPRS